MRLMSEQIKARLEAVGVSERDISASSLNGGILCIVCVLAFQCSASPALMLGG